MSFLIVSQGAAGSGGASSSAYTGAATLSGSGTLTATATATASADATLSGAGSLTVNGTDLRLGTATATASFAGTTSGDSTPFTFLLSTVVLNPDLWRAPTAVTVTVAQADPFGGPVTFQIDGTPVPVTSYDVDKDGYLGPVSVGVPEGLAAGTHTITALQGSLAGSDTFTLAKSPLAAETAQGADTAPVAIPGAVQTGFYRWVLQDLLPGGLGSYVFPHNPASWVSPVFQRTLTPHHTTAQSGQFHIYEGEEPVAEFTFTGVCETQAFHDQLVAFNNLKRRFYLIDHHNRAWKITFSNLDIRARLRTNWNGTATDWVHDYTVTALAYEQESMVPA